MCLHLLFLIFPLCRFGPRWGWTQGGQRSVRHPQETWRDQSAAGETLSVERRDNVSLSLDKIQRKINIEVKSITFRNQLVTGIYPVIYHCFQFSSLDCGFIFRFEQNRGLYCSSFFSNVLIINKSFASFSSFIFKGKVEVLFVEGSMKIKVRRMDCFRIVPSNADVGSYSWMWIKISHVSCILYTAPKHN